VIKNASWRYGHSLATLVFAFSFICMITPFYVYTIEHGIAILMPKRGTQKCRRANAAREVGVHLLDCRYDIVGVTSGNYPCAISGAVEDCNRK
jgi:hypothetical protein